MINGARIRQLFLAMALKMNNPSVRRLLLPSAVLIVIGVALVVGIGVGVAGWSVGAAEAISFEEPQSGEIGLPNESDQWTFDGVTGQDVVIQLQQTANSNLDTVLELLAPGLDGRQVAFNDDEFGRCCNSRIEYQLGETGTYTILAQGYGGWSTGTYEVSLSEGTAAAPAPDAAPGAASTLAGDIAFGGTGSGVITSGGSYGWTFEGTAGQDVTINLYATTGSSLDTYLILNNPSGAEEESNDDGGTGYNSRIQRSLDETGTYTIVARGYNGRPGSSTGAYEFTLSE